MGRGAGVDQHVVEGAVLHVGRDERHLSALLVGFVVIDWVDGWCGAAACRLAQRSIQNTKFEKQQLRTYLGLLPRIVREVDPLQGQDVGLPAHALHELDLPDHVGVLGVEALDGHGLWCVCVGGCFGGYSCNITPIHVFSPFRTGRGPLTTYIT